MMVGSMVGATCKPLQSESTLGVLLRLKSWNVLTHGNTLSLLRQRPKAYPNFDLYSSEVNGESLGWQWCSPEPRLLSSLTGLRTVVWSSRFRYCPTCIARGFHAIWFQLSALAACPLHGCALEERCAHCGAAMGPYRYTKQLFSDPYICVNCDASFFGSPCSYREQIEFFRQADAVDAAFVPLQQWLLRASSAMLLFDLPNRARGNVDLACSKIRTLDGVIRRIAPYPPGYALTEVPGVMLRCWEVQLANPQRSQFPSKRGLSLWGGRSAYQAVVRQITRHVAMQADAQSVPDRLAFGEHDRVSLSGWCPQKLALVMLRCVFEEPNYLAWNAPLQGVRLRHGVFGSVFEASMLGNVLTHAACRALVVATFLGLYDLAKQHITNGYLCRTDLNCRPGDLVLLVGCTSSGTQRGAVALPADRLVDALLPATSHDAFMEVVSKINKVFSSVGSA